jgi:hypothetical protein
MPPKKDQKQNPKFKTGIPIKDVIPPTIKSNPREAKQIRPPENIQPFAKTKELKIYTPPEEWPGDEAAKNFDFGLESAISFQDKVSIDLPPSFKLTHSQLTLWRRPKEFLNNEVDTGKQ